MSESVEGRAVVGFEGSRWAKIPLRPETQNGMNLRGDVSRISAHIRETIPKNHSAARGLAALDVHRVYSPNMTEGMEYLDIIVGTYKPYATNRDNIEWDMTGPSHLLMSVVADEKGYYILEKSEGLGRFVTIDTLALKSENLVAREVVLGAIADRMMKGEAGIMMIQEAREAAAKALELRLQPASTIVYNDRPEQRRGLVQRLFRPR